MAKFNLTIGSDPEFFMVDRTSNEPVMACDRFGGGKGNPIGLNNEGGFLEDGTAVEFNLMPAKSLRDVQKRIFGLLLEFEKQKNCKVSAYSSHAWRMVDLRQSPKAMAIGCAADLYAYGLRSAPSISAFRANRFAGGHIHVGIDPWPEGLSKELFIKLLDFAVLAPLQPSFFNSKRYAFYGYPGLYRDTSYGVEWRSPDNFWCNPQWLDVIASGSAKAQANKFIDRFDTIIGLVDKILNMDGDGKRLSNIVSYQDYRCRWSEALGSAKNRRAPTETNLVKHGWQQLSHDLAQAASRPSFKYSWQEEQG